MEATLQGQTFPTHLPPSQPQVPSILNDSVEPRYQGKKVSECQGDVHSVKNKTASRGFVRSTKIFFRSIATAVTLTYYIVKYKVFKAELTPEKFESHINTLGPVAAKLLQGGAIDEMAKDLGTSDDRKGEFAIILRKFLNKNPEMPNDEAHQILKQSFGEKYSIKKHLGTGTIASCFEVETDDRTAYVAKVVSSRKADDVAVGVKSLKMITWLLPKWITGYMRDVIDPFEAECSLHEEQAYQQFPMNLGAILSHSIQRRQ